MYGTPSLAKTADRTAQTDRTTRLQRLAYIVDVTRLAAPAHRATLGAHHDKPYVGTALAAMHVAITASRCACRCTPLVRLGCRAWPPTSALSRLHSRQRQPDSCDARSLPSWHSRLTMPRTLAWSSRTPRGCRRREGPSSLSAPCHVFVLIVHGLRCSHASHRPLRKVRRRC